MAKNDPKPADSKYPMLIEAEDDDPLFADLPEGATQVTFISGGAEVAEADEE